MSEQFYVVKGRALRTSATWSRPGLFTKEEADAQAATLNNRNFFEAWHWAEPVPDPDADTGQTVLWGSLPTEASRVAELEAQLAAAQETINNGGHAIEDLRRAVAVEKANAAAANFARRRSFEEAAELRERLTLAISVIASQEKTITGLRDTA